MPQCAPWVDNPVGRYQIVTSGTRPTGSLRPTGAVIYETDTGRWLFWTGSDWAALSSSTVGYTAKTTQQTGITTVVDITGLSVTFTAIAGRRYRVSLRALAFSSSAGDVAQVQLRDGGGTVLQLAQIPLPVANFGFIAHCDYVTNSWSGSVTVKAAALRNSGSGTITFEAGATYPAYILVEDIGV